jgi:hypothetical protein
MSPPPGQEVSRDMNDPRLRLLDLGFTLTVQRSGPLTMYRAASRQRDLLAEQLVTEEEQRLLFCGATGIWARLLERVTHQIERT